MPGAGMSAPTTVRESSGGAGVANWKVVIEPVACADASGGRGRGTALGKLAFDGLAVGAGEVGVSDAAAMEGPAAVPGGAGT